MNSLVPRTIYKVGYLRRFLLDFRFKENELVPVDKLRKACAEILLPEYLSPAIKPLVPMDVFAYVLPESLLVYVA